MRYKEFTIEIKRISANKVQGQFPGAEGAYIATAKLSVPKGHPFYQCDACKRSLHSITLPVIRNNPKFRTRTESMAKQDAIKGVKDLIDQHLKESGFHQTLRTK